MRDEYQCERCRSVGAYYTSRNCPKYFPDRKPVEYAWVPEYRTDKGSRYDVPGVESDICPVLVGSPRLFWLIDLEARSRHAKEGGGGIMFGPDASKWPAWWFDVVSLCEQARISEHNARVRAEIAESKTRGR